MNYFEQLQLNYPNTRFVTGPATALDSYGAKYITICLGGKKEEGTEYELYSLNPTTVFSQWLRYFNDYMENVVEVQVRRWPELVKTEQGWQVVGRFTFYRPSSVGNSKVSVYQ